MNLVAASKRIPDIYVASEESFAIYDTPTGEGMNESIKYKVKIGRPFETDGSEGYLFPQHVFSILTRAEVAAIHNYKYACWRCWR
jgi:hypothetical protein